MADSEEKAGGFGSLPGDLFTSLITYFDTTPTMTAGLEPFRHQILVQLAKTEHAAANADKSPYIVDVAFKCVSMQTDFLTATDAANPDPVRAAAMSNILATLKALAGLWVK
jgi:hypothetical protein